MLKLYDKLKTIAEDEYKDIVTSTEILGKRTWEQRAQRGTIYRHDNAPDFPYIKTYPQHLHDGNEKSIQPSYINTNPAIAIKQVLTIIKQKLEGV